MGLDLTADDMSPYENDWSVFDPRTLDVRTYRELSEGDIRSFCRDVDVILGAETFYRDEFPAIAREEGARTVLQINPELAPWFHPKGAAIPRPDVFLAPTIWLLNRLAEDTLYLPFPVDRSRFPFRRRTSARRFLHVAGHRAMADRAGTRLVMAAAPSCPMATITIQSQSEIGSNNHLDKYVTFKGPVGHPQELFDSADVVVLPRRYGGNSLVAFEALSSGCPVIVLDRDPDRTWGGTFTIPTRPRRNIKTQGGLIPYFDASALHLSDAINKLMAEPSLVEELSEMADEFAEEMSWERYLPRYQTLLTSVANGMVMS